MLIKYAKIYKHTLICKILIAAYFPAIPNNEPKTKRLVNLNYTIILKYSDY